MNLYFVFSAIYINFVILSNLASNKISMIFSYEIDAGYIFFPLTYFLNDLVTEFYGYLQARKMIILGFFMNLLFLLSLQLIIILPAANVWPFQQSFSDIFSLAPRIFLASLIAYFIGELLNSKILTVLKIKLHSKYMYFRFIASTAIAAFLENIIFYIIAFLGAYEGSIILKMVLMQYLIKLLIEAVIAPSIFLFRKYIK